MPIKSEKEIEKLLKEECETAFGCKISEANNNQIYTAVCNVVHGFLKDNYNEFRGKVRTKNAKQVYYMSMEFLVGTSLINNLYNMELLEPFKKILGKYKINLDDIADTEPDAGLGNGGLGRLASCYMDSLTTQGYPATGFSIRYEFGIFKQKIVDGWQMEFPDNWLQRGDVWLTRRSNESYEVKLGGYVEDGYDENGRYKPIQKDYQSVMAVPYDMLISGYKTKACNKLVLWSANSSDSFDVSAFSRGDYLKALEQNTMAEVLTKVLYPADNHYEGKVLRVKQQYLLVSASLQSILTAHYKKYKTFDNLYEKVAVHINDTHPSLCVPELMRILMDEYDYSWDDAMEITEKTLSYTNHTVMSEALERWGEDLIKRILPRIYQIICELNRRLTEKLFKIYPGDYAKIDYMSPVAHNEIRMANLCLATCHKINGVSALHTKILTESIFKDYYNIYPDKFINITNGIVIRRWLGQANPLLSSLLEELIGNDFLTNGNGLYELLKYKNDSEILKKLSKIKSENKTRLAKYIYDKNGIAVDENSIFDVQIKRLHEYKRQLLNVLHILFLYDKLKEDYNYIKNPRTFIFSAKASSGYFMAKQIIRLICAVSSMINKDSKIREKIKIVFLEDYRVSLAEIIIPAAEISQQISVAGKEASGTGNMKLMVNGALTLGTMDGANVEIFNQVGEENMFLFGLTSEETEKLRRTGYNPESFYTEDYKRILNLLKNGIENQNFDDIYNSLTNNRNGITDEYMIAADFEDYRKAHLRVDKAYEDKEKFERKALINIANAGVFSSDRAVSEYADNIWNLKRID